MMNQLVSEGDAATESAIDEPSDEGEEEEEIDDDGADTVCLSFIYFFLKEKFSFDDVFIYFSP